MNHDIISTIDEALGCGYCGGPLAGRPSDYFCSPRCQARWSAARAEPLDDYVEPDEQPAHYSNQVELHNPETCVACVDGRHRREAIASAMAAALTHGSSYVVTDEVAGFIVPSRNARRVFLNARVGVTPDGEVVGRELGTGDGRLRPIGHVADHVVQVAGYNGPPSLAAFVEQAAWDRAHLAQEAAFPAGWIEQFAGVTLADWQAEALQVQAQRYREVVARMRPALDEAARFMRGFIDGVREAAVALQPFADALAPPEPPAEPRARALWLRQHRNTGPAASARTPRAINPRRGR